METNYQRTYNEAMAKLAEAQNYQSEIINCNNELQSIYSKMTYNLQFYYRLMQQSNEVVKRQYDWIRKRDDKLNDALAKALDLVDDETDKGVFYINSLGSQVLGNIYGFMVWYNIRLQYSLEFMVKFAKITAKGLSQFPFDIRGFGW